ncbi:hypothetical protein STRIP9103_03816 [Streptomyces ipomoeae 91-03]|uniref:Uncharacterized protein n=1 Tax=Streptomyces ipomoeae 91-03 TaxID=698759 RepID=L1KZM1_9ACTN|nr:hypothetical protein STRIP9103_03816 [Streptomyces ipomoeae 91-03]
MTGILLRIVLAGAAVTLPRGAAAAFVIIRKRRIANAVALLPIATYMPSPG